MGTPSLAVGEIGGFGRRLLDQLPDFGDLPQRTFRLHGLTLRVRSASAEYLALCERALVDDATQDNPPEATVDITVIDRSHEPRVLHASLAVREVVADDITKALAATGLDGMLVGHGESWQVFDPARAVGVETFGALERLAPWERSTPLVNFMHWGFQARGMRLLHAGTLARDDVGVLIVGAGGAGKSGTVLSGIVNGLDSTGDDYIAADIVGGRVNAYPVVRLMKQDEEGLQRLSLDPAAIGAGTPNWQGKYEFDFERLGRGRRVSSLGMRAIVIPRIANAARSRFTLAPSRAAMLALAPSNLRQLPGGWRTSLSFSAAVVRALPAYFMDLSADPIEIADAFGTFIADGVS